MNRKNGKKKSKYSKEAQEFKKGNKSREEFNQFQFTSQSVLNQQQQKTNNKPKTQSKPIIKQLQNPKSNQQSQQQSIISRKNIKQKTYFNNIQQSQNNSLSLSKNTKLIKKKKVSKSEQNEGIRILQQRQNQRIFQHLCTPDGLITVQSLGRVMVRAKKEFQIEDLENMIAYYDTIRQKLGKEKQAKMNPENNKQGKGSKSIKLLSEQEESQQLQSNFEDNLDQSDNEQQEDEKTHLNFQEFKIIKQYFQK